MARRNDGVMWNKIYLSLITSARITKSNCIPIAKWAILLDFRQPVHDWFSVHVFLVTERMSVSEFLGVYVFLMYMYAKNFVCCVSVCVWERVGVKCGPPVFATPWKYPLFNSMRELCVYFYVLIKWSCRKDANAAEKCLRAKWIIA